MSESLELCVLGQKTISSQVRPCLTDSYCTWQSEAALGKAEEHLSW